MSGQTVILMYHRIAEDFDDPFNLCVAPIRFAEQIRRIRQVADPVPLAEVTHRSTRRRVAITFDDGYRDNLTEGVPQLEAEGLPATVFVTSDLVDEPQEFWPYRLERLFRLADTERRHLHFSIEGVSTTIDVGSAQARRRAALLVHDRLRRLVPAQIDSYVEQIAAELGHSEQGPTRPMLSASELRQLASSPVITIGAHTRRHPWLSSLSWQEQWEEIEGCRSSLEASIESPIDQFAYPFGGVGAFNRSSVRAVRKSGFALACATFTDPLALGTDRYRLPRRAVLDWSGDEFEARLRRWLEE